MSQEEENKQFEKEGSRFGLPEGYFQQSARSVVNKVEWLEEHKPYPVLASLGHKNPFGIPAGYFNGAAQHLELLNYPALAAVKKQQAFAVPAGYFEELEVAALATVITDEEPVFVLPPKQEPFRVPDAYFAEKAARLEQRVLKQNKQGRVIRLFASKVTRMAAAALFVMALGTWLYRVYAPAAETGDCGTIACLERRELLKSKALESMETEELYDLVNSKKLEEKLQNKEKAPAVQAPDTIEDELIDELPDEI